MSQVAQFYDEFARQQARTGINTRHFSIQNQLVKNGLKRHDRVLEVGCGIGTVSHLVLRYLTNVGALHAIDISPKSIELAKQLNKRYSNATFEVKDLTKEGLTSQFDVIILPDVIEHIPFELYQELFGNLYKSLKDDGFIFIHIPHPNYLEWLIKSRSAELQIVENPVYTDKFLSIVYPIGFYLHRLESYSLYTIQHDYQILILKKMQGKPIYSNKQRPVSRSIAKKVSDKLSYILRGLK